ncbi:MAG: hypothetical protein M3065_04630 [Actinomycetota bacterium]|nr:hypothetical protein [Actinomycetota bacterium]
MTSTGNATTPGAGGWSGGSPYWRAGGFWRNRSGQVTYPPQLSGWSNGRGVNYVPLRGVSFVLAGGRTSP